MSSRPAAGLSKSALIISSLRHWVQGRIDLEAKLRVAPLCEHFSGFYSSQL